MEIQTQEILTRLKEAQTKENINECVQFIRAFGQEWQEKLEDSLRQKIVGLLRDRILEIIVSKGDILMFANPRDDFGIALKRLGYPMNPENEQQLREATELLKDQKMLVQAYVMDEIFDKMIGGEAAIAPYYAGDAITMMADNEDLGYFVPEEGTNRFVDAIVIPKGSKEKECAEMFINFLLEAEVGAANAEYIGYSSPNDASLALLPEDVRNNPIAYPSDEVIAKTEFWIDLPAEMNLAVDAAWTELLSTDVQYSKWLMPGMMAAALLTSIGINVTRAWRRRREREDLNSEVPKRL